MRSRICWISFLLAGCGSSGPREVEVSSPHPVLLVQAIEEGPALKDTSTSPVEGPVAREEPEPKRDPVPAPKPVPEPGAESVRKDPDPVEEPAEDPTGEKTGPDEKAAGEFVLEEEDVAADPYGIEEQTRQVEEQEQRVDKINDDLEEILQDLRERTVP